MASRQLARVGRIEAIVANQPVHRDLVDAAFELFRETGMLPDETRVASEVVGRALATRREEPAVDLRRGINRLCAMAQAWERSEELPPLPGAVRERLFQEAVRGETAVRAVAREALQIEVDRGGDVTDPQFLADRTLPEFGSVGLHLLGFPECLAIRPYKAQARRLFQRIKALRERLDPDPAWHEPVAEAIARFEATGELPAEGIVRDIVLADAELVVLDAHAAGIDVSEQMAALDAAARTTGAEREAAIVRMQQLMPTMQGFALDS